MVVRSVVPVALLVDRAAHHDAVGRELVRQIATADAVASGADPTLVAVVDGDGDRRSEKPRLVGSNLTFNVSDTDGWLAVALYRGTDVGIDVERADRRTTHTRRLAERILTDAELAAVDGLDDEVLDRSLIATWTRKEAVLKACGIGLRRDLRTVDVADDVVHLDGLGWRCHTAPWGELVVSIAWPA